MIATLWGLVILAAGAAAIEVGCRIFHRRHYGIPYRSFGTIMPKIIFGESLFCL